MKGIKNNFSIILLFLIITGGLVLPEMSASAATKAPSKPGSVKAVSYSYNSSYISWNTVSGVSGYKVYRATSSKGTYKLIMTTTAHTYKNTGLTTGTTYYYKIKAYKITSSKMTYSSFSTATKAKPIPSSPTLVKTTSSYDSVNISWGGVAGATRYQLFRSTSKTGTYKSIATIKGKSYKDKTVSTGTTYYYKVRACKTVGKASVYSNYSVVVCTKPSLSAPSSLSVQSSTESSIQLSWKSTSGASGYQLYRATQNAGTYELLATVSTTSYDDSELTSGTTYYYKVRAYRKVDQKKVYSSYSSSISKKISQADVQSVSLNKTSNTLALGETYTLKASITPQNATNKSVTWKSSDKTVATVSSKGKITAVATGSAIIYVTTDDGEKTATCKVTVKNAEIKGIDVSKWQGNIDWEAVEEDGVEFAMLRASYGSSSVDPMFEKNYQGAKDNGIAVGAYHYSYATTVAKATTEVEFFIKQLEGKTFEYPVCVDIEDSSQSKLSKDTLTKIALVYLDKLKEAGYYPVIYTNKTWFTTKLDDTKLEDYDHWLAQWGSSITYSGAVGLWQYSSSGSVNGISGRVDVNTSFVDYASKIKLLNLNGF
ncbi:GH25 family lysozyme [Anaeromicropila herbilytica]|uniref:Fibronectin type-III domain-containing protein n=1 Tax=Anaeromicropila herbilytica TaxID=2785025 RepID=A0A7R7ENS9_9FIRM|nr:GH25 family lysozyme [Anaeromicropila herbilytica]BCN31970.1 hypothetical protein bsdtb5_32650 [Anaeromicropila herbilytica]